MDPSYMQIEDGVKVKINVHTFFVFFQIYNNNTDDYQEKKFAAFFGYTKLKAKILLSFDVYYNLTENIHFRLVQ